ncbi:hypothetical protein G6O69_04045 [Pseudenhygromyxa sp. WMMC2535]|uniref:hypothetical protein n=1 Tax=Pseudenhygromyxa sp. WMMC2535 TaxID=2712867 RepID=UPI0015953196|nr:hypothetical protein [Pseudenhygromyxa sp. WMMC2535]NVB36988.1 hypothetical protein [Pseudenhygromyxa sp. WMMC2535]
MSSRAIPTSLILSLAFVVSACGDDAGTETSTSFSSASTTGDDSVDGTGSSDEIGDTGSSTGSDSTTSNADMDESTTSNADMDETASTTTETDTETTTAAECLDLDQDGYGENCEMGADCDDSDYNNHTDEGCANCMDADGDGQWVGCDIFDENKPGEDCDDNDYNVFTPSGCANCSDEDMDNYWVGCDQYGDAKPGPDCDDGNSSVGVDDAVEICNGLAENCAGEVDNASPDEMCPTDGADIPNVNPMNGWNCNPPAPGEDGCEIASCVEQFFDLDGAIPNGCECAGTPRTDSLAACSGSPQGELGSVGEGEQLTDLVVGTVPLIDNGVGSGREDWFWVEFPENDATGVRPVTGSIQVSFIQNDNSDYRFEVYRSCNGVAFDTSLATAFGSGAPPAREWWFFDNHTAAIDMPVPALYTDNVNWPDLVYIRVFRVQNDLTCNSYQLQVKRVSN